jgi:serine/threonine protein kinase
LTNASVQIKTEADNHESSILETSMLAPNSILRGRYRIVQLIGKGGMGAVFEAIDQTFENVVAIKQMLVGDEHLRKAFEREARLLNRLRHRALPVVTDYFFEADGEFLVMQYIPGNDLGAMLKNRAATVAPQGVPKPFDVETVLNWADQLLDALDYLHTQNPPVLHRDIKPQNLKLNERGEIILLDFGLAKGAASSTGQTTAFTSIYGYTPSYAPLEQIQGSGTSTRSDLYSLAATVYNLLTGVTPVDALTRATAAVSGKPDPLKPIHHINPQVSEAVANILMSALSQNPERRPDSAARLRNALRNAPHLSKSPEKSPGVEKASKANRFVVQLKPDEVGKPEMDSGSMKPKEALESDPKNATKAGQGADTQATIVRPKRAKTKLQEPTQTNPEAERQAERKPKRAGSKKKSPPAIEPIPSIYHRHQEIFGLLIEGCDDAEIAKRLALTKTEVANFLNGLSQDIGVITRKDLILWAMTQVMKSRTQKSAAAEGQKGTNAKPDQREGAAKQPPKSGVNTEKKAFETAVKIPPPQPPPLNVDSRVRPTVAGDKKLFKSPEDDPQAKAVTNESEDSPLGNFLAAVGFGFFATGAFFTLVREIEKGHSKSFGEIVGLLLLGGLGSALGIACLGSIVNFFTSLKRK